MGTNGFKINRRGVLVYFTVPSFEEYNLVSYAFTSRLGGVSPAPFESLNLGMRVGDEHKNVISNRERACEIMGVGLDRLVAGRQVHGNRVFDVTSAHAGRGAITWEDALPDVDALVTAETGVLLSSYYADCVPLVFLDPVQRVVALAHAGWKGTVQRIGAVTIGHMGGKYGSRPGDILAAVGPSIGPCCYEVDAPVLEKVKSCLPGYPDLAHPGRPGHWWLDLPEMNRRILIDAGVNKDKITISGYCTSCSGDLLFSHRRQKGRAGRMASLIMLTRG